MIQIMPTFLRSVIKRNSRLVCESNTSTKERNVETGAIV